MKEIPGFENYLITRDGRVWSNNTRDGKGKWLYLEDRNGYLWVGLSRNSKKYWRSVHRLVAMTYIPNPENKADVDHINNIRSDNRVENLQWLSREEHNKKSHYDEEGNYLFSGKNNPRYDTNIYAFIKDDRIERLTKYDFYNKYNLDPSAVTKIVKGKMKSYKGWKLFSENS